MVSRSALSTLLPLISYLSCDALAFAYQTLPLHRRSKLQDHSSKRYFLTQTAHKRSRQSLWAAQDISAEDTALIIEDRVVGSGPAASPGDIVTVKYTGRLESNGKQFDAGTISFKLGEGKVIPGWEQGIENMQAGGSRKLIIPPELAYGRNGAGGGIIPPNATLLFDVELDGISAGPLAELIAATGIGSNPRTAVLFIFVGLIAYLVSSVTFPEDM